RSTASAIRRATSTREPSCATCWAGSKIWSSSSVCCKVGWSRAGSAPASPRVCSTCSRAAGAGSSTRRGTSRASHEDIDGHGRHALSGRLRTLVLDANGLDWKEISADTVAQGLLRVRDYERIPERLHGVRFIRGLTSRYEALGYTR